MLDGTKQAGNLCMTSNTKSITVLGFTLCVSEPRVWRKATDQGTLHLDV